MKISINKWPEIVFKLPILPYHDASAHQWVVQGAGTVSADGAYMAAPIPFLGQYAVVLPDHGFAPPSLVNGQPLPPFSATPATDGITAAGKVIPPAAPPSVGLRAVGEVIANNDASPLYSGLLINGRVTMVEMWSKWGRTKLSVCIHDN